MDEIEILIKSFASKGKSRSEVVTELIHQGYAPDAIEASLNKLYSAQELPKDFWQGMGGTHSRVLQSAPRESKKILVWIGIGVVLAGVLWGAWMWYQDLPRTITQKAYSTLAKLSSFEFSLEGEGEGAPFQAQGIVIPRGLPALSGQIGDSFSFIAREGKPFVFKAGTGNELASYGWIEAPTQIFFDQGYRFNLQEYGKYLGIVGDLTQERGEAIGKAVEFVLRAPLQESPLAPPQGYKKGIQLLADAVLKRQLVESILGKQEQIADDLAVAQWHLFAAKDASGYVLSIQANEGRIAQRFNTMRVVLQNFNKESEIPFDAVPTPFQNIVIWTNGQ